MYSGQQGVGVWLAQPPSLSLLWVYVYGTPRCLLHTLHPHGNIIPLSMKTIFSLVKWLHCCVSLSLLSLPPIAAYTLSTLRLYRFAGMSSDDTSSDLFYDYCCDVTVMMFWWCVLCYLLAWPVWQLGWVDVLIFLCAICCVFVGRRSDGSFTVLCGNQICTLFGQFDISPPDLPFLLPLLG